MLLSLNKPTCIFLKVYISGSSGLTMLIFHAYVDYEHGKLVYLFMSLSESHIMAKYLNVEENPILSM